MPTSLNHRPYSNNEQGLSLISVLVGLAVFGVVIRIVAGSFDLTLDTLTRTSLNYERATLAGTIVDQLSCAQTKPGFPTCSSVSPVNLRATLRDKNNDVIVRGSGAFTKYGRLKIKATYCCTTSQAPCTHTSLRHLVIETQVSGQSSWQDLFRVNIDQNSTIKSIPIGCP